ncbi:GNAT family N-acetyltransferase [Zavarzinia compransoris]|uniref:GNAT family N-acetyltransferase n=1 Tax=Zavarzinia compransoris TaxID=1264899 RepID=A0A317DZ97_9PROT|nr:N-acetyltransferase [Zavarzinia compransoris]PWR19741.1 GNAT family N-acetyltransferase [Zavarzinia compransoris]TDP43309.1 putative acetyltransferase [Zavarzinia compransoris]
MLIRNETAGDVPAIGRLVTEALRVLAQSTGTEAGIVEKLRAQGALALSLVAEAAGEVIGYLAASPARIGTQDGWALIGPLAVLPSRQRQGIGTALMAEALRRLRATGRGAALVGDPTYYGRFGFRAFPGLGVAGCPPEVVQALPFDGQHPCGELIHHPAFGLDQHGNG